MSEGRCVLRSKRKADVHAFIKTPEAFADAKHLDADKTGPPDSKYCDDGGVYYTYSFIEDTKPTKGGDVGWPWGADQLEPKANISLKVGNNLITFATQYATHRYF